MKSIATLSARQAGFNLVELMVSLTIGLFLLSSIVGIVVTMRSSFSAQDGLTQTQESERFMLSVLNTTVHNGGYFTKPLINTIQVALPVPTVANGDGTTFAAGQFLTGTVGSGTASDTLDVRFQTDSGDSIMNCNGDTNTSGAAAVYTNSFAVNATGQLTCAVSINGAQPSAPAVLVDNVSSMKILYGVDTDNDGNVDTYLTAADVTSAALWTRVGSVRLTFALKDLVKSTPTGAVNLPSTLLHVINVMNR